jgi:hypothetical protein
MSPTELTLADFDYTFDDPFLRAAFAQESFKFRYQRKDPYIRVKWWFIIVNDPFSRSVPPRKVSQFKLGERWSEPIGANFIVKVDIHRLAGLSLAVIPEWVESRLTFQDKKVISQIQVSSANSIRHRRTDSSIRSIFHWTGEFPWFRKRTVLCKILAAVCGADGEVY